MEKLTADQILNIVENNMDINQFGEGYYPNPKDFEYSDEVKKARIANQEAYDALINHPTHKLRYDEKEADADYQKVRQNYLNSPSPDEQEKLEFLASLGLGKIVEVDSYGGSDQGTTWYSVKHFVDHDVYIQTDGYYSSYEGVEFEDYGYEVKPEQVMVTQYKPV